MSRQSLAELLCTFRVAWLAHALYYSEGARAPATSHFSPRSWDEKNRDAFLNPINR
jgi:hypothetical protein